MPPLSCFLVLKQKFSHNGKQMSEYIVLRESYMRLLGKSTEGDWCILQRAP